MKATDSITHQTIHRQPAELRRMLAAAPAESGVERAAAVVSRARRVFLVGTGTSFHAAQIGQYLFRNAGIDAFAVTAFEFALYPQPLASEDVVLAITHRGTKKFMKLSLEKTAAVGASTVIITGRNSPLIESKCPVIETSDQEKSSAHTVSYLCSLAALAQIAHAAADLGGKTGPARELQTLLESSVAAVEQALTQENAIAALAREVATPSARIVISGPGPSGVSAVEGALKCKETSYATVEGSPLESFLHGPLIGLGRGDHVIALNPFAQGAAAERNRELAGACKQIGISCHIIGASPGAGDGLEPLVKLDYVNVVNLAEAVPLQLLGCYLAEARGTNPDGFRLDVPEYAAAFKPIKL